MARLAQGGNPSYLRRAGSSVILHLMPVARPLHIRAGTMHRLATLGLLSALAFAGCATDGQPEDADALDDPFTTDGKLDGVSATPAEAAAILHVVNTETRARLVSEVRLAANAADAIVAVRTGDDGAAGTADDHPFGSLAELDAVPYVGPVAFGKLMAYVHEADLVGDVPFREWHSSTVANGSDADLTVSPDGKPVAVFYTGTKYQLRLPSGSVVDLPEREYLVDSSGSPQVAIDDAGVVHILFAQSFDETGHLTYRNGTWTERAALPRGDYQVDQSPGGKVYALRGLYAGSNAYSLLLATLTATGSTEEALWDATQHDVHLNVDSDGFPSVAWAAGTIRNGRRTAAGWQTRDSGQFEHLMSIATTGGPSATVAVVPPTTIEETLVFRQQGSQLVGGRKFNNRDTVHGMDATLDALGTAHLCQVDAGNIVHVAIATTGDVTSTPVGAGDSCWIGLDAAGDLHLMSTLGNVINHARFE